MEERDEQRRISETGIASTVPAASDTSPHCGANEHDQCNGAFVGTGDFASFTYDCDCPCHDNEPVIMDDGDISVGPPDLAFIGEDEVVVSVEPSMHFVDSFSDMVVRRTARVPLEPDAREYVKTHDLDEVYIRDLDLLAPCIFCTHVAPLTPLEANPRCVLCYGTGYVAKSIYFEMRRLYIEASAMQREHLADHPTVVRDESGAFPVAAAAQPLTDLPDALDASYHASLAEIRFACTDVRGYRVYVRWRRSHSHYFIWLQPIAFADTKYMREPIYHSRTFADIDYVLRHYLLGKLNPDAAIWRPIL